MSLEQAVDFAMNLSFPTDAELETAPVQTGRAGGLTEREMEIAGLIGQGMTNGEIAGELVLSKRTVETHIHHILSKLGLTSRAQIIRWVLDQGLAKDPIR
jgi:DNA-binding NarL/FixJ family response regulator